MPQTVKSQSNRKASNLCSMLLGDESSTHSLIHLIKDDTVTVFTLPLRCLPRPGLFTLLVLAITYVKAVTLIENGESGCTIAVPREKESVVETAVDLQSHL